MAHLRTSPSSPHEITRANPPLNVTRNAELTTEINPYTGTLIFTLYCSIIEKYRNGKPYINKMRKKFTQNFLHSHAKEYDLEETRKKCSIDQILEINEMGSNYREERDSKSEVT